MRRRFIACIAAVALIASAAHPAVAQPSDVDAVVHAFMASRQIPGMVIGIEQHGRTALLRSYGLADRERQVRATIATRFEIGSITKQFTAAAVLQLVEAGRVRLSDPLAAYVPQYSAARAVTIRQLLDHTSGIPDFVSVNHFLAIASHRPGGFAHILALVADRPLEFAPGSKAAYSNTNYVLLGRVIEIASRQGYDDFVRTHVLARAGMSRTTTISREAALRDMAVGYNTGAVTDLANSIDPARDAAANARIDRAPSFPQAWVGSAGDLVSDATDLLKWDDAYFAGAIVGRESVSSATTSGTLPDGTASGYGFGWEIDRVAGHRRIFQDGGTFGFASTNQTWPDDDIRVVILANSAAAPLTRFGAQIFQAFAGVTESRAASPAP